MTKWFQDKLKTPKKGGVDLINYEKLVKAYENVKRLKANKMVRGSLLIAIDGSKNEGSKFG